MHPLVAPADRQLAGPRRCSLPDSCCSLVPPWSWPLAAPVAAAPHLSRGGGRGAGRACRNHTMCRPTCHEGRAGGDASARAPGLTAAPKHRRGLLLPADWPRDEGGAPPQLLTSPPLGRRLAPPARRLCLHPPTLPHCARRSVAIASAAPVATAVARLAPPPHPPTHPPSCRCLVDAPSPMRRTAAC